MEAEAELQERREPWEVMTYKEESWGGGGFILFAPYIIDEGRKGCPVRGNL